MACSLRSPPRQLFWLPSPSLGQRKGLGFQFHKHTADTADGTIEVGGLRHFEIGKHARSPRLQMPLEESRLLGEVSLEVAAGKTGHDLEQDRDMIFRLPRRAGALDPEPIQIFADPRQRALVK